MTCSIAVLEGQRVLTELNTGGSPSHSRRLLSDVLCALERHRLSLCDVDLFCVGVGPGSFTGVRVGMATLRALAWSLGRPLAGVGSLPALAMAAQPAGRDLVVPALDARKGEVYAAAYRRRSAPDGAGRLRTVLAPTVLRPHALLRWIASASPAGALILGTALQAYPDVLRTDALPGLVAAASLHPWPSAAQVGRLGLDAWRHDPAACDPIRAQPLYVRASEAELRGADPAVAK